MFEVGDLFIGRKSDILNLRGVIGEVREDGRQSKIPSGFESVEIILPTFGDGC